MQLGQRDTQTGQQLWKQLDLFEIEKACTDHYSVYNRMVPEAIHVQTKAETYSFEGLIVEYVII